MSRTRSTFYGVISSQLYMLISVVINLVATPFIIKGLNVQLYGLSILIFQLTGYLGQFDFGLGAGVSRFLVRTRENNEEARTTAERIISTSLVVYTLIGTFVALLGVLLAPFVPKLFAVPLQYVSQIRPIISSVCVLVGLQLVLRSISGIFFAHQKQVLSNTLSFILTISSTLTTLLLIYTGHGLWSFVYAAFVSFIINAALTLFYFNRDYKHIKIAWSKFDFVLLREIFSFGIFLFLNGIAVQVVFQSDRMVIGSVVSLAAVSIYSLTTKIPELVSGMIWKIMENSFPAMVELSHKDKGNAFFKVHNKLMQLTLSVSTVFFWLLVLFSFPFLKLWVGEKFYAGFLFVILASYLYLFQHTVLHVTSVCLNSAGLAKGSSIISIIEAVLNLAFSIPLCRKFGLNGVLMGTIVAGLLTSVWYVPYAAVRYRNFDLVTYLTTIAKPILGISVFGFLVYLLFSHKIKSASTWFEFSYLGVISGLFLLVPVLIVNRKVFSVLKASIFTA